MLVRREIGCASTQLHAAAGMGRLVLGREHAWGEAWVARLAAPPLLPLAPDRFDARLAARLAACQALVYRGQATTYPLVAAPAPSPRGSVALWGPGGYLTLDVPLAFYGALVTPDTLCVGIIHEVADGTTPMYLPGLLLVRHGMALALHVGLAMGWFDGFRAAIERGLIPILPPPAVNMTP